MKSLGIKPTDSHKKLIIPNTCPFKGQILKKVLAYRQQKKLECEKQKLLKKKEKKEKQKEEYMLQRDLIPKKEDPIGLRVPKSITKSWGQPNNLYIPQNEKEKIDLQLRELNQIIDTSHVIVQVLDARDPNGCRCQNIEKQIVSLNKNTINGKKQIIFLINKIDLIPSDILTKWINILREDYPVAAFKSSTLKRRINVYSSTKKVQQMPSNICVGISQFISLLKKNCCNGNNVTPLVVGFIGRRGVGTTSVINSLKKQYEINTPVPIGFSSKLQELQLVSGIKLINSSGVIVSNKNYGSSFMSQNVLRLPDTDPINTVKQLVSCCDLSQLQKIYELTSCNDVEHFLVKIGEKYLFQKSDAINNEESLKMSARNVINDWNSGKILFYVSPPESGENKKSAFIYESFDEKKNMPVFSMYDHYDSDQFVVLKREVNDNNIDKNNNLNDENYEDIDMEPYQFNSNDFLPESDSTNFPLTHDH